MSQPGKDGPTPSAVPVMRAALGAARDAEAATRTANAALLECLPFHDRADFDDAHRGLVAPVPDGVVRSESGNVLWNLREYGFLDNDLSPSTVNPSLWRMARLNMANGLFRVVDRLYQLRGFDLANMTVIEGDTGLIVIDPLSTAEVAKAAFDLYCAYRPRKLVVAVIYTHSHGDHFGGVKGVVAEDDVRAGRVAVIAPDGFMEAIGGENVLAGLPMSRRAQFQFGTMLPRGPRGQVDAGLGKGLARGRVTLIAPTDLIRQPVETRTIDGVEIVFQLAPETEAPAEMHMFYPQLCVLNMAENACRHLHNFVPLRGSLARDPRVWSRYIADAMELYGGRTDVLIGQHHWPVWGRAEVLEYLGCQRDLYKYLHDQALRLIHHGWRPGEIAEALDLPPGLADRWPMRGYYGTVRHNVKAVYQRYLSWYDGNPANLNPLTPRQTAKKTVEYMGGGRTVIQHAREDFSKGEFRWVAQVMTQVIFADPDNGEARALGADAFEQLGYQAESATWRNAYLYAAQELRHGPADPPPRPPVSPDVLVAVPTDLLFDLMAVRLDAVKAAGLRANITWHFTDTGETVTLNLDHATLTHRMDRTAPDADATVTTTRAVLESIAVGSTTISEVVASGRLCVDGDAAKLTMVIDILDRFDTTFDVVTPGEGRP